jgi:hypothetical protein
MGQKNEKQQKPMEEEKDAKTNQSIVNKFAFFKLKHKKTRHRLPLELECEIFKFLKLEIQQKLIWGMGPGIYGIFRQKVLTTVCWQHYLIIRLLIKCKRLQNPKGNGLCRPKTKVKISSDGLKAKNINQNEWHYVFAKKGFAVSGVHSRPDNYPGTILYYFEVKLIQMTSFNWSVNLNFSNMTPNIKGFAYSRNSISYKIWIKLYILGYFTLVSQMEIVLMAHGFVVQ